MGELDYRISHFKEHLGKLEGKKTFLYGAGKNAAALIEHYDEVCHFSGVITSCLEKENHFCGKRLLTLDEALNNQPDIILIAAQMYSADEIYQRIHSRCRESGVALLDMYGADQIRLHDELEACRFQDFDGWKQICSNYDVVSFELPDTLIERDLLNHSSGSVRPVFKHLIRWLREQSKNVIFIGAPEDGKEWYYDRLKEGGVCEERELFDSSFYMQDWMEKFFRSVAFDYPGMRLLHIGHSLLENGIIPRLCGWDTYRMVFFDKSRLTAFFDKKDALNETWLKLPDYGRCVSMIDKAQAVTFDVFDTLLVRQTEMPEDVFVLAARRAVTGGILPAEKAKEYVRVRRQKSTGCKTLRAIIREVCKMLALPSDCAQRLEEIEIETDTSVLMPREAVCGLFREAVAGGKKVLLVSDMYYTGEQMEAILKSKGITGYEKLYVSCEHELLKRDGLIRTALRECDCDPDMTVHFGDSTDDDEIPARTAGIGFAAIPSVRQMADGIIRERSGEDTPGEAELVRRVFDGMWAARTFNDPFGRGAGNAAMAVTPVLAGCTIELMARIADTCATGEEPDAVLFAARDGYLPRCIYDMAAPGHFPKSKYFFTSRKAAFETVADRAETTGFVEDMAGPMPAVEAMKNFYGIDSPTGSGDLPELIRQNRDAIRDMAGQARKAYEDYWKRTGLKDGGRYIYVDFVAAGTSQRMLQENSPFRLYGYYAGRTPEAPRMTDCVTCYLDQDRSDAERAFLNRYLEMEHYMTCDQPSLAGYRGNGSLSFADEIRSADELEEIRRVHGQVREFFGLLLDICGRGAGSAASGSAFFRSLSEQFPADEMCAMYLAAAGGGIAEHFYDDWSGTWM